MSDQPSLGKIHRNKHFNASILLLSLLLALVWLNLTTGATPISSKEIVQFMFGGELSDKGWETILLHYRLPKTITAIIVGSGLSVCGLSLQSYFHNPLAGPFVLGISAVSSLGVAILLAFAGSIGYFAWGSWAVAGASILGAMVALSIILLASFRIGSKAKLLIIGVMLTSFSGALLIYFEQMQDQRALQAFINWSFGNIATQLDQLPFLIIPVIAGLILLLISSKELNLFLLGEEYAKTLGASTIKLKFIIVLCSSIIVGCITAFCGPIGFIGIAIPHLTRMIFRTYNHFILIPAVALCGACLLLACDIVCQLPAKAIPINAVTALIGAPIVVWVLLKYNHEASY